jgi:hypothetical protein
MLSKDEGLDRLVADVIATRARNGSNVARELIVIAVKTEPRDRSNFQRELVSAALEMNKQDVLTRLCE